MSELETELRPFKTLLSYPKLYLLLWYYLLSRRLTFQCMVESITIVQINIIMKWKGQSKCFAKWKFKLGTGGKNEATERRHKPSVYKLIICEARAKKKKIKERMQLCNIFSFKIVFFLSEKQNFNFTEHIQLVCLQLQCIWAWPSVWVGHESCIFCTQHPEEGVSCPMPLTNPRPIKGVFSFIWCLQKDNCLSWTLCWYFVHT